MPQIRTAKLYRESCASQGLLSPLSMTSTSKKKTFIFSSSVLLLCVHTQYNPFAHPSHPSCSYYYLLSPIYCFCTSYLFCTFLYSIAHFSLYFSFLPIYIYIYIHIQWGKKVFSQPPIVQVLPLKKMREACNFHHRYTSTMRDKIRKKNPENHIGEFLKNLFANYGGK